jgi:hypothetical protein
VFARFVDWFDQNGVDGAYHSVSAAAGGMGGVLRLAFTGRVQQYAALSFLGVVVVAALFLIF